MSAVLQKLKGAGLGADAMQTRGYDLQPEFDYANGRQTLRGYRRPQQRRACASTTCHASARFVDLAVSAGATSVGGVRFDLEGSSVGRA